ncbi:MAG: 2-dehydro-3-deoxygalactonokinase [Betaproteobacteria bacterium]
MLAIDWGNSSFRAYRLDPQGGIVDSRSAPAGILCVAGGNFAGVLEQQAGDWIAAGETPAQILRQPRRLLTRWPG